MVRAGVFNRGSMKVLQGVRGGRLDSSRIRDVRRGDELFFIFSLFLVFISKTKEFEMCAEVMTFFFSFHFMKSKKSYLPNQRGP